MQKATAPSPLCKPEKLNFLDIDHLSRPYVKSGEQQIFIPDNDFGRWFVRSRFEHMGWSATGAEWYAKNDPAKSLNLQGLLKDPRVYQRLALFRMKLGSCALWLDMGLGKTFISFLYALTSPQPFFLVVCPPTIFNSAWCDQIEKLLSPELNVRCVIAHGPKRKQVISDLRSRTPNGKTFILTSFDSLESIRESLQYLNLGAIFFDEAQKIKYLTTGRTKAAHALVDARGDVPHFLLSGTPSTTKIVGYYSLYELLHKGATGCSSLFAFKRHFIDTKKFLICRVPTEDNENKVVHIYADATQRWLENNFPPGETRSYADLGYCLSEFVRPDQRAIKIMRVYNKEVGIKNLADLQRISTTWSYTVRKEDVAKELPPKTHLPPHEVEMTAEQEKAYADLLSTHKTEIGTVKLSFRNTGSIHAKLHQVANGYLKSGDTVHFFKTQPKIDALLNLIEEAGDQKIVIWSPWIPQLQLITAKLKEEKLGYVLVYGKTSQKDRDAAESTFTNNPDCKIFVGNPTVAGMGLNLQCAHLEIFMSNWYQPDVRDQAEDRCHRLGQSNGVSIIDLVTKNTLEAKILRDLRAKISTEDAILSPTDLGAIYAAT